MASQGIWFYPKQRWFQKLIFFESPHRIHKSLKFIFESKSAPDELFVCRELTKVSRGFGYERQLS